MRAEIASLADPAVGALLSRRGYVLSGFENVLGLASRFVRRSPGPAARCRCLRRENRDRESELWADTVVTGFLEPRYFDAPPSGEIVDRQALDDLFEHIDEVDGLVRYLARRDGESPAAAACGSATASPSCAAPRRSRSIGAAAFRRLSCASGWPRRGAADATWPS